MRNPLTLRLCCLVAMAPALTSDLTSRVSRQKSSPLLPSCPDPALIPKGREGVEGKLLHLSPIPKLSTILRSDDLVMTSDPVMTPLSTAPPASNGIATNGVRRIPAINISPKQHTDLAELSAESAKRQKLLESRHERLLKRLRRLQSRQSISHVKQQMSGFVCTMQQNLQTARQDYKSELLQGHDVKNLSTAALVNLVQKLQASQPGTKKQQRADADAAAKDQLQLEEETCLELDRVAGHLQWNLRHLEKGIDSDATESSSGGESADEMELMFEDEEDWAADRSSTKQNSLCKQPGFQWAGNRAAIASRWTWLQAQVSDLEYRIRQQNDIFRQIRASKGAVTLDDPQNISSSEDKLLSSAEEQTNDSSCVAARCRPVKSCRKRKLLKTSSISSSSSSLGSKQAALTPLLLSQRSSTKGASPCARCGGSTHGNTMQPPASLECHSLLHHSLPERAAHLDNAFHPVLSFTHDIALSVHFEALLKQGDWQSQEKLPSKSQLKSSSLQSEKRRARYNRDKARKYTTKRSGPSKESKQSASPLHKQLKMRYQKASQRGSQYTFSRTSNSSTAKQKSKQRQKLAALHRAKPNCRGNLSRSSSSNSMHQTGDDSMRHRHRRSNLSAKENNNNNAYDINNIVIPYSIAASTRLLPHRLKYKEIETPKWRLLGNRLEEEEKNEEKSEEKDIGKSEDKDTEKSEDKQRIEDREQAIESCATKQESIPISVEPSKLPEEVSKQSEEEQKEVQKEECEGIEDLRDETYARRHLICEVNEKQRFNSGTISNSASRRRSQSSCKALREEEDEDEEDVGEEEMLRRRNSCSLKEETDGGTEEHLEAEREEGWLPRLFPLLDLDAQPDQLLQCTTQPPPPSCNNAAAVAISKHDDLMSYGAMSAVCEDEEEEEEDEKEDADDPEWTVVSTEEGSHLKKRRRRASSAAGSAAADSENSKTIICLKLKAKK